MLKKSRKELSPKVTKPKTRGHIFTSESVTEGHP